jgi:hypothetical protein
MKNYWHYDEDYFFNGMTSLAMLIEIEDSFMSYFLIEFS